MITSNQNSKVKSARLLSGRGKEREAASAFLAEGVRLVEEAFHAKWPFRYVLYSGETSGRGKALLKEMAAAGIDTEEVESRLLQSISETENSQGLLAVLEWTALPLPARLDFVLIPDSIRDPGNLGTLLRTAQAVGVQAVLVPPETADAFAPKVVRSGMGAHFRLPVRSMSWKEIDELGRVSHLQFLLADMDGRSCWELDLRPPLGLIVGGEAEGASRSARSLAAQKIGIPMGGRAESLNAAVAGSVLMVEVMRQRRINA